MMARVIKPLVIQQIKNAKEGILRDGDGLFLKVTHNSKIWRFAYIKPFSKNRTDIKLGVFPEMSLLEARQKRSEYKMLLAQNVDPLEYQKQQMLLQQTEQENTFKNVAIKWRKNFKSKFIMTKTMNEDWRRLENHIFPKLGDIPIAQINSKILIRILQPLYQKGFSNALEKTLRTVVEIMDYAENTGLIDLHNCQKARKSFHFTAAKNNPTILPNKVPQLIDDIFNANIMSKTKLLIFWSLLTAVRPAEVVSVEWSEIDWKNHLWHIPKEKMKGRRNEKKPHTVPLCKQALWVLKEMKKWNETYPFVFAHSLRPTKEPMSSETVNNTLKRNGYHGILTSHGIRSIIRTYLADIGIERNTAEKVLAHKIDDTLEATYNRHDYLKQRIPVMQQWGDYLEQCGLTHDKIITC